MKKEQACERIMDSAALIQASIAKLLTAKAGEAKLAQGWIAVQIRPEDCEGPEEVHQTAMEMHDQMIEILEGITKMEIAIARQLRLLLEPDEEEASSYDGLLGSDRETSTR